MEWNDYLNRVIETKTEFDGISICANGISFSIPPMVKASVLMLDDITNNQGENNIIVFPTTKTLGLSFLLAETIHSIATGVIGVGYDPHTFQKGQKLRYMDCVVVFDGCDASEEDGQERIWITFGGKDKLRVGIPKHLAPFFQLVESKQVSKYKKFSERYAAHKGHQELQVATGEVMLDNLANYKTHLTGTIVFVSEIKRTRDFFTNAEINGKQLSDILYLAHITGNGSINNITPGQMRGNPAIAVATDLYSVINSIDRINISKVIFDDSHTNSINDQLDAVDELLKRNIPFTCITDTVNSFENAELIERGFNEWRWDKDSITEDLYVNKTANESLFIRNCAKHKVNYIIAEDPIIDEIMSLLYRQRNAIAEQSSSMMAMYDKLFSMAFWALRRISQTTEEERKLFDQTLQEAKLMLENEKRFISSELFRDCNCVIDKLASIIYEDKCDKKLSYIEDILKDNESSKICIVVSDKQDKQTINKYWNEMHGSKDKKTELTVVYPQDYVQTNNPIADETIVVGWLGKKNMKNIIYRYASECCDVLLYSYENNWRKAHTKSWEKAIENTQNSTIIEQSFNKGTNNIDYYESKAHCEQTENEIERDELEDIEQLLQNFRYRKYETNGNSAGADIRAIPVSFVGGLLAFYRCGHKVVSVTEIVRQIGESIKLKTAEDLDIGDFIVVREAEKDIIRELADTILLKAGKYDSRKLSQKWRESLEVESIFSTPEEIYEKLKRVGCKRDYATVRNWITNDDLIAPQDKEDLLNIAAATNDEVLLEQIDSIYAAASEVKSAHIRAGRLLSDRLLKTITNYLRDLDSLDPFNIWDPIKVKIDEIGTIRILKVIDIGEVIQVDSANINRLLNE